MHCLMTSGTLLWQFILMSLTFDKNNTIYSILTAMLLTQMDINKYTRSTKHSQIQHGLYLLELVSINQLFISFNNQVNNKHNNAISVNVIYHVTKFFNQILINHLFYDQLLYIFVFVYYQPFYIFYDVFFVFSLGVEHYSLVFERFADHCVTKILLNQLELIYVVYLIATLLAKTIISPKLYLNNVIVVKQLIPICLRCNIFGTSAHVIIGKCKSFSSRSVHIQLHVSVLSQVCNNIILCKNYIYNLK